MSRNRIDELNVLAASVMAEVAEIVRTIQENVDHYDSIDFLIDLLYSTVIPIVEDYLEEEYDEAFHTSLNGWLTIDPDELTRKAVVYAEVDGKTFADRIMEYAADGLDGFESKLITLLETDGHRVRSEGSLGAGKELQDVGLTVTKTWKTVKDEKVRDAHNLLHGTTIPYNEQFEINGFKAPAPGLFGVAELDCNCRCEIEIGVTEQSA